MPRDARVLVGSLFCPNLVYLIYLIKVACGGTVVPGANKMNPRFPFIVIDGCNQVPFIWYKLLLNLVLRFKSDVKLLYTLTFMSSNLNFPSFAKFTLTSVF